MPTQFIILAVILATLVYFLPEIHSLWKRSRFFYVPRSAAYGNWYARYWRDSNVQGFRLFGLTWVISASNIS